MTKLCGVLNRWAVVMGECVAHTIHRTTLFVLLIKSQIFAHECTDNGVIFMFKNCATKHSSHADRLYYSVLNLSYWSVVAWGICCLGY